MFSGVRDHVLVLVQVSPHLVDVNVAGQASGVVLLLVIFNSLPSFRLPEGLKLLIGGRFFGGFIVIVVLFVLPVLLFLVLFLVLTILHSLSALSSVVLHLAIVRVLSAVRFRYTGGHFGHFAVHRSVSNWELVCCPRSAMMVIVREGVLGACLPGVVELLIADVSFDSLCGGSEFVSGRFECQKM